MYDLEKNTLLSVFDPLSFSEKELQTIQSCLEKISLKKGSMILTSNEVVYEQYYVQTGCLRTFYLDKSGKEHTLQFAINDWWISDYTAFFNTQKSILNIEAIQDATLFKLTRADQEKLYQEIPKIETFFRKKMEKAFSSFQKRILENLSLTAKEQYLSFIFKYPNIEQNVKNYHIASYLGITTESLSRIRKELSSS
ncbi:Crp/Fnr family transcriptional regulator [Ochrovirga pacifica]|uniref:Crp/Fnr family transcriptional regulator n=1 Tax=Ochrovirga pacifica TaxID=1042376 RepID=UPI00025597D7|nr:Crp/Fnr family transcriptional regulator [Ochrovirga pacifica]